MAVDLNSLCVIRCYASLGRLGQHNISSAEFKDFPCTWWHLRIVFVTAVSIAAAASAVAAIAIVAIVKFLF
jgi:hypothetical protein